jgi:hypothetical protein
MRNIHALHIIKSGKGPVGRAGGQVGRLCRNAAGRSCKAKGPTQRHSERAMGNHGGPFTPQKDQKLNFTDNWMMRG